MENNEVEKTENVEPTTEEKEKTFTQSEFVKALEKEVARKTKGLPSKEELDEFTKWKDERKSNEEKLLEMQQKLNEKDEQIADLKNYQVVANAGIDPKFTKFVQSEVKNIEGDFEENLNKYLKENPQYLFQEKKFITTGVSQKTNEVINENKAYLDKKYANNPYYKK